MPLGRNPQICHSVAARLSRLEPTVPIVLIVVCTLYRGVHIVLFTLS